MKKIVSVFKFGTLSVQKAGLGARLLTKFYFEKGETIHASRTCGAIHTSLIDGGAV